MEPQHFQVPDELELEAFFGCEPVERAVDDGYWSYEVRCAGKITLRFSFQLPDRSVQTELRQGSTVLAVVCHEMATNLRVENGELRCQFESRDSRGSLVISAAEGYSVSWSTLRTE